MSTLNRTGAHAALFSGTTLDRLEFEQLAHDIVDDLCNVTDAIAAQAAAQTRNYLFPARPSAFSFQGVEHRVGPDCPACNPSPSTSPPPSKETEAEKLQSRLVEATERIAHLLEPIAVNAKAIEYASLRSTGYAMDDTRRAIQTLTDYQAPPRTERNKP